MGQIKNIKLHIVTDIKRIMSALRLARTISRCYSRQITPFQQSCLCSLYGNTRNKTNNVIGPIRTVSNISHAVDSTDSNNDKERHNIFDKVKKEMTKDVDLGKVYAIVYIAAQQFKVSTNDIIIIHKRIEADCGDMIRLEKVLSIGCRSSSLVGMPLLKREVVNVQAVVMEKTKGEKKQVFKKKRRKGYKKWLSHRQYISILKIKSIHVDTDCI